MQYIGAPRWRYLLFPFVCLGVVPMALLTFATFGTVRAIKAWSDLFDWCLYWEKA